MQTKSSPGGVSRYLGRTLDEKYRLEQLLGEGGMGAVFLATHLGTGRYVAVKLIAPRFMGNERFVARFRREARAAGRLRHPNIVDVTDFGFAEVDGETIAYLVMEYLDGCTLAHVLDEEKRLPISWVVDLLGQVCSAVQAAHNQGIIHRDLKPDNIWLEPNSLGGYRVKVLDFGIAKMIDPHEEPPGTRNGAGLSRPTPNPQIVDSSVSHRAPDVQIATSDAESLAAASTVVDEEEGQSPSREKRSRAELSGKNFPEGAPSIKDAGEVPLKRENELTHAGAVLGTPRYMSPEQRRGEALDARSDVFSLGVIAYLMLGGKAPFDESGPSDRRRGDAIQPVPLEQLRKRLPRRFSQVVMTALNADPAARPPSATAFADALRANAEGLGTLYRRAFALYSEYFPTILKVSLLAHLPVFFVVMVSFGLRQFEAGMTNGAKTGLEIGIGFLRGGATWITASCISGVIAIMVTQLAVAPLRPLRFRDAFQVLQGRWRPFVRTGIRVTMRVIFGFVALAVPGFLLLARYLLWAPVVLMEQLEGKRALRRSVELAARSRRDMLLATVFQLGVPTLMQAWVQKLIGQEVQAGGGPNAEGISQLASLVSVLVSPLVSIVPALLYLKMRQYGGESLAEVMAPIEVPGSRRKWELRMRERLNVSETHKT